MALRGNIHSEKEGTRQKRMENDSKMCIGHHWVMVKRCNRNVMHTQALKN